MSRMTEAEFGDVLRRLSNRPPLLPKSGVLSEETPTNRPICPGCDEHETRWRGPHPKIGETVVEVKEDMRAHMGRMNPLRWYGKRQPKEEGTRKIWEITDRDAAAIESYAGTDTLTSGPLWLPHRAAWLWQPAMCLRCEDGHRRRWFDSLWPPMEEEGESAQANGRKKKVG